MIASISRPPVPARIGAYAITGCLKAAGHAGAAIYIGEGPGPRHPLILKAVGKTLSGEAAAALRREAALFAALRHPQLVAMRGYHEDADWACMLMAPAGESLSKRLAGAILDPVQTVAWMTQLLDALDYLHGRGIVHGDIHPGNLLIGADARLRVGDFGLARRVLAHPLSAPDTRRRMPAGTLSHMAPELLRGAAPDAGSDLFAAAVVFYRLLTGQAPFAGTPFQIMQAILGKKVTPPSRLQPKISPFIDLFFHHALARNAPDRPQSSTPFREVLSLINDASACA